MGAGGVLILSLSRGTENDIKGAGGYRMCRTQLSYKSLMMLQKYWAVGPTISFVSLASSLISGFSSDAQTHEENLQFRGVASLQSQDAREE